MSDILSVINVVSPLYLATAGLYLFVDGDRLERRWAKHSHSPAPKLRLFGVGVFLTAPAAVIQSALEGQPVIASNLSNVNATVLWVALGSLLLVGLAFMLASIKPMLPFNRRTQ